MPPRPMPEEKPRTPMRVAFIRFLPLLVLALGLVAFFALDGARFVSFERLGAIQNDLKAWVAANPAQASFAYMAAYAAVIALSLPIGTFATILGGLLFGPVIGTLWAAIGATFGASGIFLAARTALGDFLRGKAGSAVERMEEGFRANAFNYLLVLRLVPVFPFWLINLVPAFSKIPLRVFAGATFLGILPATFVYAGVGHGLSAVLAEGRAPDLGIIAKPEVLLPILGLAALALLPVAWKRWKARRARSPVDV